MSKSLEKPSGMFVFGTVKDRRKREIEKADKKIEIITYEVADNDGHIYYVEAFDPENYYDAGAGMEAYLFGEGDDPYFARNYSLVGDNEDRATLIELLYNRSLADTPAESAEAMRAYPHLRAKLDFMAERVREFFGTVYWEEADGA